jgi:hypothetical protein
LSDKVQKVESSCLEVRYLWLYEDFELSVDRERYQSDEEKAKALMEAFFPTPPMPEASNNRARRTIHQARPLKWPCLTKHEVERAIFRSNPDKALGKDEISFRVWREL